MLGMGQEEEETWGSSRMGRFERGRERRDQKDATRDGVSLGGYQGQFLS